MPNANRENLLTISESRRIAPPMQVRGPLTRRLSLPKSHSYVSLLEQILKCLPRIVGPRRSRRGRFFLPRHSHLIKLAIVARVFARNPHRDGLHALEAAAGIEVRALLAGVQFEAALGALAGRRHALQHGAALRAAGNGMRSRQVDRARAEGVVPLCGGGRRAEGFFSRALPGLAVAVLIPVLAILSCHKTSDDAGVLSRQRCCKTSLKLGAVFLTRN